MNDRRKKNDSSGWEKLEKGYATDGAKLPKEKTSKSGSGTRPTASKAPNSQKKGTT